MNCRTPKALAVALAVMSMTAIGLAASPSTASAASAGYYWYPVDLNGNGYYDAQVRWNGSRWDFAAPIYFSNGKGEWAVAYDYDGDGRHDHALFSSSGQWQAGYSTHKSFFCTRPASPGYAEIGFGGLLWDATSCSFESTALTIPRNRDGMQNLLLQLADITRTAVGFEPAW